ncbi:MAG: hypothetical protein KBT07_08780 [Clostridiales bacterium]|nr:hypothetical protein [Candidatus Scatonaster coprocaballi]
MELQIGRYCTLKDPEQKAQYVCSVCSNVGLVSNPSDGKNWHNAEACQWCGFEWGIKRDEKKWYDAWMACGGERLFDKPYKERCEYFNQIANQYMRSLVYMPTKEEIAKLSFDDRLFSQYGLEHILDRSKRIVVEYNGVRTEHEFETNKVIKIHEDGAFFAICLDHGMPLLLASYFFSWDRSLSERVRIAYFALNSELFEGVYVIGDRCQIRGKDNIVYTISIEKKHISG